MNVRVKGEAASDKNGSVQKTYGASTDLLEAILSYHEHGAYPVTSAHAARAAHAFCGGAARRLYRFSRRARRDGWRTARGWRPLERRACAGWCRMSRRVLVRHHVSGPRSRVLGVKPLPSSARLLLRPRLRCSKGLLSTVGPVWRRHPTDALEIACGCDGVQRPSRSFPHSSVHSPGTSFTCAKDASSD